MSLAGRMSSRRLGRYTGLGNSGGDDDYYYESGDESETSSNSDSESEVETGETLNPKGIRNGFSEDSNSEGESEGESQFSEDSVSELSTTAEDSNGDTVGQNLSVNPNTASVNLNKRQGDQQPPFNPARKRVKRTLKDRNSYTLDEALVRLQFFLDGKKTALETLASLNQLRRQMEATGPPRSKHKPQLHSQAVYITNAIELLMNLLDILQRKQIVDDTYSLNREQVSKLILEECTTKSSVLDDAKDKVWYFKWFKNPTETHGPFSSREMQYWKDHYFKGNVIVRFGRGEKDDDAQSEDWIHIACITFIPE